MNVNGGVIIVKALDVIRSNVDEIVIKLCWIKNDSIFSQYQTVTIGPFNIILP